MLGMAKRSSKDTVTVYARMPVDLKEQLEAIADREDRSLSWLIVRAVKQFLENENGPADE